MAQIEKTLEEYNFVEQSYDQFIFTKCRQTIPKKLDLSGKPVEPTSRLCFYDTDKEVYISSIIVYEGASFTSLVNNYWWNGSDDNKKEGLYSLIAGVKELEIRHNPKALRDLLDYKKHNYKVNNGWKLQSIDKAIEIKVHCRREDVLLVKMLRKHFDNISVICITANLEANNTVDQPCSRYRFTNCRKVEPQSLVLNVQLSAMKIDFHDAGGAVYIPSVTIGKSGQLGSIVYNSWQNSNEMNKEGYYSIISQVKTLTIRENPEAVSDLVQYIKGEYKIEEESYTDNKWKLMPLSDDLYIQIQNVNDERLIYQLMECWKNARVYGDNISSMARDNSIVKDCTRYTFIVHEQVQPERLFINARLTAPSFECLLLFQNAKEEVKVPEIIIGPCGTLDSIVRNGWKDGNSSKSVVRYYSLITHVSKLVIDDNPQAVRDLADYIEETYQMGPSWGVRKLSKNLQLVISKPGDTHNVIEDLKRVFRTVSVDGEQAEYAPKEEEARIISIEEFIASTAEHHQEAVRIQQPQQQENVFNISVSPPIIDTQAKKPKQTKIPQQPEIQQNDLQKDNPRRGNYTQLQRDSYVDVDCYQHVFTECRNIQAEILTVNAVLDSPVVPISFIFTVGEVHIPTIVIERRGELRSVLSNRWWNGKKTNGRREGRYNLLAHAKKLVIRNNLYAVEDLADYVLSGKKNQYNQQLDRGLHVEIENVLCVKDVANMLHKYFQYVIVDGKEVGTNQKHETRLQVDNVITQDGFKFVFIECAHVQQRVRSLVVNAKVDKIIFNDAQGKVAIPNIEIREGGTFKSVIQNGYGNVGGGGARYCLLKEAGTLTIRNNPQAAQDLLSYVKERYMPDKGWYRQKLKKSIQVYLEGVDRELATKLAGYFDSVFLDRQYVSNQPPRQNNIQREPRQFTHEEVQNIDETMPYTSQRPQSVNIMPIGPVQASVAHYPVQQAPLYYQQQPPAGQFHQYVPNAGYLPQNYQQVYAPYNRYQLPGPGYFRPPGGGYGGFQ